MYTHYVSEIVFEIQRSAAWRDTSSKGHLVQSWVQGGQVSYSAECARIEWCWKISCVEDKQ
jgi:hypothetical protein